MRRNRLLFLFLFPLNLLAQINPGPRITALGTAGVALQDIWSMQSNQAGLTAQKRLAIAAAYEDDFLNPDLSKQSLLVIYPNKRNAFGISFQNYGFSAYKEQRLGIAFAREFGNVSAALNFNYHLITIQQYGGTHAFSVEAGIQYQLNDKFLIGAHISNPNRSTYNHQLNAALPVSIEVGISYKVSSTVLLTNEVEKTLNSATDTRAGLEYSVVGRVDFRGGISVNPFRQYVGVGFKYKNICFDAAASSHFTLGYSPQVALSYEF